MSPPRPKNRLYLKRCGVVYDISKRQSFSPTAKVCHCTTQHFGNNTVNRFYGRPSRKPLRKELRSYHAHEVALFLNSKEQHCRHKAKCCSLDQEQENIFRKKCASRSTKKIVDIASLPPTVRKFTIPRGPHMMQLMNRYSGLHNK